jgi:tetratricopeptide (TPR) repeat protein
MVCLYGRYLFFTGFAIFDMADKKDMVNRLLFEHPEWFWGFLPWTALLIGLYFLIRSDRNRLAAHYSTVMLQRMGISPGNKAHWIRYGWFMAGLGFLLVALANPRTPGRAKEVDIQGSDVVLVLDISRSMRVKDVAPDRLKRSTLFLEQLLSQIPGERVGLVFFAGSAYVQMPLTTDHAAALLFLRQASPEQMTNQGTAIGDALDLAAGVFDDERPSGRTLILLSDGEDHYPETMELASRLPSLGIDFFALGIGTRQGGIVPGDGASAANEGQPVISRFSPDNLNKLAREADGRFFDLNEDESTAMQALVDHMAQAEKTKRAVMIRSDYLLWYQIPLGLAFICLLFYFVWPLSLKSKTGLTGAWMLIFFLTSTSGFSQNFNRQMRKGAEAFDQSAHAQAETHFEKAGTPDGDWRAVFNRGTTRMAKGDAAGAAADFEQVIKNDTSASMRSDAWYQSGLLASREENWEKAIHGFTQSLKEKPGRTDAAHNLLLARKRQKQAEEEKKQQEADQQKGNQNGDNQQNNASGGSQSEDDKESSKAQPQAMTPQNVERLLEAIQKEENKVQNRMGRQSGRPDRSQKNW